MSYEQIEEHLQHLQHVTDGKTVVLGPDQIVVTLPRCSYCNGLPAECHCGMPRWHLERSIEPDQEQRDKPLPVEQETI